MHDSIIKETTHGVLWLGAEAPSAELVEHLRVQGFVLTRSFGEDTPSGLPLRRLTAFDPFIVSPPTTRVTLGGRRIALIQPDPASADVLAQALRAKGAEVIVLSFTFDSFERAEHLDPDVVLIEPSYFRGQGWELMGALWQHPRLRWATVLLTSSEAFGFSGPLLPDLRPLCATIQRLCVDYDQLRALSRAGDAFDIDLHTLGPARILRLLVSTSRPLRAEFSGPHATITVDAAKELVVGARCELKAGGPKLFGPSALAMCLSLERGHVSVRAVERPSVANVMAPLDVALHAAAEALMAEEANEAPTRPSLFEDTPTRQWEDAPFARAAAREWPRTITQESVQTPVSPTALHVTREFARFDARVNPLGASPRTSIGTVPFPSHAPRLHALVRTCAVMGALLLLSWMVLRANEPAPRERRLDGAVNDEHVATARHVNEPGVQRAGAAPPRVVMQQVTIAADPALASPAAMEGDGPKDSEVLGSERAEDAGEDELAAGDEAEPLDKGHGRSRSQRAADLARQGHVLRVRGMYTEARGKYLAALETVPRYPRALAGLAQIAMLRDDGAEAAKYAEQLVAERPGQAVYHLILGDAYRATGQLTKARAAWRVASELGSTKARSRLAGKRAHQAP